MITQEKTSILIANTQPEHIASLAAMQRVVFPTLNDNELYTEAKYRKHIELFPEGQFVALVYTHGEYRAVGSTTTFRTHFDFDHPQHTYLNAVAGGWLTNHDPEGEWLYGADMSVHPDFRGYGIGKRLYEARRKLVRRLNLRGEIAGAMLPGYHHYCHRLTVPQYVLRVTQGKLIDPTLSMQLKMGFDVRGILYNHLSDPRSRNTASLIVRENASYKRAY
jgi:GNAT superfamily N-acetyltransferase